MVQKVPGVQVVQSDKARLNDWNRLNCLNPSAALAEDERKSGPTYEDLIAVPFLA